MKKLKSLFSMVLVFCCWFSGFAQGLKVGDKMPEVTINNVYNYIKPEIQWSDLKGKVVILDFWSRGCKACVEAFPKVEALQRKFGDKIQILVVSSDDKATLDKYLSSFTKTKVSMPNVPSVTSDTLLGQLFPHIFVPHHVWIDKDGVVQAITDGYNTNEESISKLLNGLTVSSENKKDIPLDYFQTHTLWDIVKLDSAAAVTYSFLFTRFLKSNTTKGTDLEVFDSTRGQIRTDYINGNVLNLYLKAFNGHRNGREMLAINRVIWEIKDSSCIAPPSDHQLADQWKAKYQFNYEQIVPFSEEANRFELMKRNLNSYFGKVLGIGGQIEQRSVQCLVLKTKGKFKQSPHSDPTAEGHYRNVPFPLVLLGIKSEFNKDARPFIDETGITGNVDMDVFEDYSTIKNQPSAEKLKVFNQHLARYNLRIIQETRRLDMLVMKEVSM